MALNFRATCSCGWTGDWTTSHFVASGEETTHTKAGDGRDDCDGETEIEAAWDYEIPEKMWWADEEVEG